MLWCTQLECNIGPTKGVGLSNGAKIATQYLRKPTLLGYLKNGPVTVLETLRGPDHSRIGGEHGY